MLSIIIITKNEEKVLPRLLESIKHQKTKFKFEVIVSDADSKDKTKKIAKKYKCKIVKGGLPSKGRNNGAKAAKYELLVFLDADTELPDNFVNTIITEYNKGKFDCATTIYKPITNNLFIKFMYWFYNQYVRILQYILPHGAGLCIIIKKELHKKINGFDEKWLLCEDMDYIKKAGKQGRFKILTKTYIKCDIRRIEIEGKFKFILKYSYGGIYRLILGDRKKPLFEYKLHGSDETVNEIYDRIKNN